MSEECSSERVHMALVQVMPEDMVLEGEPIHHGCENVGHGRVGHLGVLNVEDSSTLCSKGGRAKVPCLVEDRASKEVAGTPILGRSVCGVIAVRRGNGVVRHLGPGSAGVARPRGISDLLNGGLVEDVNSFHKGLEG